MENPKFTRKVTTTLKVSGLWDTNGILLDDDGNTWDLLALMHTFKDQNITISVKNVQEDE